MIISHKHKFIFLHSRKCAGSSVKVALSGLLGSDDVMIGSWNEARDAGVTLNRRAKIDLLHPYGVVGFAAGMAAGKSFSESINIGIKNRYIGSFGRNAAHPTASAVKKYYRDVWDEYMIFSICRNPYERVVSDYLWRVRTTKISTVSFSQYLDDIEGNTNHTGLVHKGAIKNSEIVSIDNESVLDFVCKYENISEDFAKLCAKLDLGSQVSIGRAKMGSSGKGYNEYHTDETIETVNRLFRWEIETFGYEVPYQNYGGW